MRFFFTCICWFQKYLHDGAIIVSREHTAMWTMLYKCKVLIWCIYVSVTLYSNTSILYPKNTQVSIIFTHCKHNIEYLILKKSSKFSTNVILSIIDKTWKNSIYSRKVVEENKHKLRCLQYNTMWKSQAAKKNEKEVFSTTNLHDTQDYLCNKPVLVPLNLK